VTGPPDETGPPDGIGGGVLLCDFSPEVKGSDMRRFLCGLGSDDGKLSDIKRCRCCPS
jgi:hypothetical protein